MLDSFIREPLLHFMVIGIALFGLFSVVSGHRGGADHRIVVSDAAVAAIVQRHQSVWQRAPTPAELQGLIDSHVREEILYREGVALGLDRDDPVVRRRVMQKLELISEESTAQAAPSDADLDTYLTAHAERYALPAVIGFEQVVFDPVRRASRIEADVAAALARLRAGANPADVGDRSLLPTTASAIAGDQLARDFGDEFAAAVIALPVGDWQGPVRSGYGIHLVRVIDKTPGRPATMDDARAAVERDWGNERRIHANEEYYQSLRKD